MTPPDNLLAEARESVEYVREWLDDEPMSKPPFHRIGCLLDMLDALTQRNERLAAALEPFGNIGELIELETTGFDRADDLNLIVEDGHLLERIPVGAFLDARSALNEARPHD